MNLDPALLDVLACPACHASLRADDVAEDSAVLLVDEARQS